MRRRAWRSAGRGAWSGAVALALVVTASAGVAAGRGEAAPPPAAPAVVRVAVAANFAGTLDRLAEAFEASGGAAVAASPGSTGKLYGQIKEGAPFDLFLSADAERPRRLEEEGVAVDGSRFTYVLGRLVLWSPRPGVVDPEGKVLAAGGFGHLAIANPKTAPYGAAAEQVLRGLGLWEKLAPRLVRGEDVGQTHQFVASGNAELGFLALSQVKADCDSGAASCWLPPPSSYPPLEQQAVLLVAGRDNPAAAAFLAFLRGEAARPLLTAAGYGLP